MNANTPANWKGSLSLPGCLDTEVPIIQRSLAVSKEIHGLMGKPAFKDDRELLSIADAFEQVPSYQEGDSMLAMTQRFEDQLKLLYAWADKHHVWITTGY